MTSNGGENKQQKWLVFRLRQLLYTPEEFELLLRRRTRVSFSNGKKKKEGKEKTKKKTKTKKVKPGAKIKSANVLLYLKLIL